MSEGGFLLTGQGERRDLSSNRTQSFTQFGILSGWREVDPEAVGGMPRRRYDTAATGRQAHSDWQGAVPQGWRRP